tara:strand:- start:3947 stop:4276 length:330 start_codon:yes stop_codon:yes gene_type:complete
METANKDLKISKLQNILSEKKKLSKKNIFNIRNAIKTNPDLEHVYNQYKDDINAANQVALAQIKALELLSEHISSNSLDIPPNLIKHSKKQQNIIYKEINKIKNSILII